MKNETNHNMEVISYLQTYEIKNKTCDMDHPFAFISYAHDDDVRVIRRVFSELYDSGFNLWIDVANLPVDGNTWEKAAIDAIASKNCKALIYFRSPISLVKSTIQREIQNFSSVEGRTGSDIITVDLSGKNDMHTTPFLNSLKETDTKSYEICKSICDVISSHCNALRYHMDYRDFNDFLGTVINELSIRNFHQNFSVQQKVEFILDGTFHVNLNAEQRRIMDRYRFLLNECMNDPTAKRSLLIIGRPGVGKTVMAMMMLNEYVRLKKTADNELPEIEDIKFHLVSKNSGPRDTYKGVLEAHRSAAKKAKNKDEEERYRKLLEMSDSIFRSAQGLEDDYNESNQVDVIVVDEAHRLEDFAQYEKNRETKKNQPEAVAKVSRLSVFFCDPEQMVTFNDFGSLENLKKACKQGGENSRYFIERMSTQMRCDGADSYMEWLDCLLQMEGHDEPEAIGKSKAYDLRSFDNPLEMFEVIKEKNKQDGPARVLAGMCWPWPKDTREKKDVPNVVMPEYNFAKSWNLDYSKKKNLNYVSDKDSIEQIGCIHTVQGLEFTYAGVIIGGDMRYENGKIVIKEKLEDYGYRVNGELTGKINDYSNRDLFKGAGTLEKEYLRLEKEAQKETDKEKYYRLMTEAKEIKDEYNKKCEHVIKNVYRVLLSRGVKGGYVFCVDPGLREYFKKQIDNYNNSRI